MYTIYFILLIVHNLGFESLWGPLRQITYVPSLNFKTCHFAFWGGTHVAVSILLWYMYNLCFSLSLLQFLPIFVLFVVISAVLSVSRPCCLLEFYLKRVSFMCLKTFKFKSAFSWRVENLWKELHILLSDVECCYVWGHFLYLFNCFSWRLQTHFQWLWLSGSEGSDNKR